LQQRKPKVQTLLKEMHRFSIFDAIVSLHGSSASSRKIFAESEGWPEIPNSDLLMRALFRGMTRHLALTCATACHQRCTAREIFDT
jgi:hypothetical protein